MPTMPSIMPSAVASLRKMSPTKLLKPMKHASSQLMAGFNTKRKVASIRPFSSNPSDSSQREDSYDDDNEEPAMKDEESFPSSMESHFFHLVQRTPAHELRNVVRHFFQEVYLEQISVACSGEADGGNLDDMLEALYILFRHVLSLQDSPHDVLDAVRQEFDAYVFPLLVLTECENLSAISPKQIAKILSFVSFYMTHWSDTLFPEDRLTSMEQLSSEYLRRGVHDQVRFMVENRLLLLADDEVVESENGILCTRISEDVDLIITSQLEVAAESLPPNMTPAVLRACNEELHNLAGGFMFHIEASWKIMSVERLCCCINDAQLLLDQFEARNESLLGVEDEVSEHFLAEFSLVALHATRFLCERLLTDLKDDHLLKIGSAAWEQDGTIIDTVVITLKDYFGDIINWVPAAYFFPKILKTCLDLILSNYVESFFANTMACGLQNRDKAAATLTSDRDKLLQFFGVDNDEYLGCAGFYDRPTLRRKLVIIEGIANILQANSKPAGLQEDFQVLLKGLGVESGAAAIFHIFGLQNRRIGKSEAQVWHETIALAQEHLLMQDSNGAGDAVRHHVPDLRNSVHLKKMKKAGRLRNKNGLDLTNTNRLIQPQPAVSKLVSSSRKMLLADRNLITSWRLKEEL